MFIAAFALVACGGDGDGDNDAVETETIDSTDLTSPPSTAVSTLPAPDSDWAGQVIDTYGEYTSTDLDRVLTYVDAAAGEPGREVELFAQYLRAEADALGDTIAGFPTTQHSSPDLASSMTSWIEALEARRAQLVDAATELTDETDALQAELDAGGSPAYEDVRARLGEDDDALQACFAVQTAFDERRLGVLRCLPGQEGDEPPAPAEPPPAIDLGPDAVDVSIDFSFEDDSGRSTGPFVVTAGAAGLGCQSGRWSDVELSDDLVQLTKTLECVDGDRAGGFTVTQLHDGSNRWTIEAGTDGFATLGGEGTFVFDPATTSENWTGRIALGSS